MIVCPACHAENPEGTKICVKCGTELPKTGSSKTPVMADSSKGFGVKDISRDLFDFLWLLLIIFLIGFGFVMQAGHWTWPPRFSDQEEAVIIQKPMLAKISVHKNHVKPVMTPKPTAPVVMEKPVVELGSPDTFYQKGKKQFDSHQYQASFNSLRQALEIDPTYGKAYYGLGYLYARFDMNDAAVRMYEMALRFDPNHADSIHNLGMMYFYAGNYDDALPLLQKAVASNSENAEYQYHLGKVYYEKDRPEDALPAFQKAVSLKADDAAFYNDMALTYEKLGKKQEAEDAWQKVLQYSDSAQVLQQAKSHLDFLQAQS